MYEDLSRLFNDLLNMLQTIETIALIPTILLLVITLSQYLILILKPKKKLRGNFKPSVSVLIPAHNEGKYLKKTIESMLNSGYEGKKEIIVIDDGSTDNTSQIIKTFKKKKLIKSIRTNHIGKSKAMNKGLKLVKNEIVITVDGDSRLEKGSIGKLVAPFYDKIVAATTGVIKVANTKKPLSWFQKLEYLNFAFFKSACERINAVIAASGPLSAFRKKYLVEVGGFSQYTFLEDFDVALKLIKKGYKTHFVDTAFCYNYVPDNLREFVKQRFRWTRGGAQIIKIHFDMFLNKHYKGPGMYSLPLLSYWYIHSILMGIALIFLIALGYNNFFLSNGVVFSLDVAKYFFYWFSVFGIINVGYEATLGNMSLSILTIMNMLLLTVTYGIFLLALKKFKEPLTIKDIIAFIFMFPYWLILLLVHSLSNIEWFKKRGKNWWKK